MYMPVVLNEVVDIVPSTSSVYWGVDVPIPTLVSKKFISSIVWLSNSILPASSPSPNH